jgi:hypothetical protein
LVIIKEKSMHKYIENYFRDYKFSHEVNFFRKKIDFVFIDNKERIHAVELKINDWKNALLQIDVNQLGANFCYLGIWHAFEHLVPRKIFKKNGIGLISISRTEINIILKPKKSLILSKKLASGLREKVLEDYK